MSGSSIVWSNKRCLLEYTTTESGLMSCTWFNAEVTNVFPIRKLNQIGFDLTRYLSQRTSCGHLELVISLPIHKSSTAVPAMLISLNRHKTTNHLYTILFLTKAKVSLNVILGRLNISKTSQSNK